MAICCCSASSLRHNLCFAANRLPMKPRTCFWIVVALSNNILSCCCSLRRATAVFAILHLTRHCRTVAAFVSRSNANDDLSTYARCIRTIVCIFLADSFRNICRSTRRRFRALQARWRRQVFCIVVALAVCRVARRNLFRLRAFLCLILHCIFVAESIFNRFRRCIRSVLQRLIACSLRKYDWHFTTRPIKRFCFRACIFCLASLRRKTHCMRLAL